VHGHGTIPRPRLWLRDGIDPPSTHHPLSHPTMQYQPTTDDTYDELPLAISHRGRWQRSYETQRRPRPAAGPESPQAEVEDDFQITYRASHAEALMLRTALSPFFRDRILTDVLAPVKGGKEATVYCCQAHPSTGLDLIAAKIYRPRAHRSLSNDAPYREGREMLDDQGKGIRDARRHRAIAKKTRFGKEVEIGSWIEHEYATLKLLFEAGADVPKPIARVDAAILMAYLGELHRPAPNLHGISLPRALARPIFERLLAHVELMLAHNRVHADLSAYNILYWQGQATIIDFPQAVFALSNRNAYAFLLRDLTRLCQHFERYGLHAQAEDLAQDLWQQFQLAQL